MEAFETINTALREFDCRVGDARAYHLDARGDRHTYVVLGFIGESAASVAEAIAAELGRLRCSLAPAPAPILYIRRNAEVEREPDGTRWCASVRIAIPGADWSKVITKPEGLPYPPVPGMTASK